MDELERRIYRGIKESYRRAVSNIEEDNLKWDQLPVIIIDYYSWEVMYFENEFDAKDYLEENRIEWDEEPPYGEDKNLIVIKFYTEEDSYKFYRKNITFYKEINGKNIYRQRSFVDFEPELVVNVHI